MKLSLSTSLSTSLSGFGGFSVWTPLKLTPEVWVDATQLTGLSEGDPAGAFTDLSGHGRHFGASGTARPTYRAAGINGRPALEGDGVDDAMTLANFGGFLNWWGIIVFQPVTMAGIKALWALADYPANTVMYRILETNSATTINLQQLATPMSSSITLANGVKRAIFMKGATTSIAYQSDNGILISKTVAGDYPASGSDGRLVTTPMRLFARGDPGLFFNVRIGELVFGSGTLTAGQQTALWTYLNAKWGTAVP